MMEEFIDQYIASSPRFFAVLTVAAIVLLRFWADVLLSRRNNSTRKPRIKASDRSKGKQKKQGLGYQAAWYRYRPKPRGYYTDDSNNNGRQNYNRPQRFYNNHRNKGIDFAKRILRIVFLLTVQVAHSILAFAKVIYLCLKAVCVMFVIVIDPRRESQ